MINVKLTRVWNVKSGAVPAITAGKIECLPKPGERMLVETAPGIGTLTSEVIGCVKLEPRLYRLFTENSVYLLEAL
jgi:hypothetical protein